MMYCIAAGGCFPAALCRCVLRSRHRFRDGLLLAGCIRRLCRGVPRTRTVRRVFDRERGVRGFPVVLHSGRDADVYGGRAGGMAVRRRICRCPVRRSRRGRGVVPCRKERPGFRCVSGPRRRDATYGAGGIHPGEPGMCLHGSLIGPSRFHAFRLMARPRGGRSLRRFCMVFRAAGGLCRRVG